MYNRSEKVFLGAVDNLAIMTHTSNVARHSNEVEMTYLNGNAVEILAPRALRKGDVLTTPRGTYTVLGNCRSKGMLRYQGAGWKFALRRSYESIARVMGI